MFISDKAFSVVWPKKDGKKNLNTAPECGDIDDGTVVPF